MHMHRVRAEDPFPEGSAIAPHLRDYVSHEALGPQDTMFLKRFRFFSQLEDVIIGPGPRKLLTTQRFGVKLKL